MLRNGTIIGDKYRLEEPIGQGGMATVWRARHIALDMPVAVKFLEAVGPHSETLAKRFLQEAKLAAGLHHRHVVDIVDVGVEDEAQPYMVMEFLVGQSLADRYDDGPEVSDWELLEIACMTLSGLAAVHDAGIIHRDVKPENIFLVEDADGIFPKLLDFGISRGFGSEAGPRMTRTGAVIGTPQYMSPEQARGLRDVDGRSDLWAVAVLLYEGLTGEVPFDSENPGDVLIMVATEDPVPLRQLRPDLPRELLALVHRGLSRNRDRRFQTAREMRGELLEILRSGKVSSGRPPPDIVRSQFGAAAESGELRALSSLPDATSAADAHGAFALVTPSRSNGGAALAMPLALAAARAKPREDDTEQMILDPSHPMMQSTPTPVLDLPPPRRREPTDAAGPTTKPSPPRSEPPNRGLPGPEPHFGEKTEPLLRLPSPIPAPQKPLAPERPPAEALVVPSTAVHPPGPAVPPRPPPPPKPVDVLRDTTEDQPDLGGELQPGRAEELAADPMRLDVEIPALSAEDTIPQSVSSKVFSPPKRTLPPSLRPVSAAAPAGALPPPSALAPIDGPEPRPARQLRSEPPPAPEPSRAGWWGLLVLVVLLVGGGAAAYAAGGLEELRSRGLWPIPGLEEWDPNPPPVAPAPSTPALPPSPGPSLPAPPTETVDVPAAPEPPEAPSLDDDAAALP